jgi:hypothetical protein
MTTCNREPSGSVADDGLGVTDRRQRRVQGAIGVVGDDVAHQHPDRRRIGERLETTTPDELAVHDIRSGTPENPQVHPVR